MEVHGSAFPPLSWHRWFNKEARIAAICGDEVISLPPCGESRQGDAEDAADLAHQTVLGRVVILPRQPGRRNASE